MIRPWLTPEPDQQFDQKAEDINTLYQQAPELVQQGERVLSTDELTGVQALERKHPGLPLALRTVLALSRQAESPDNSLR